MITKDTTRGIIDTGTAVEMERLVNKSVLINNTLGSPLPGMNDAEISFYHRVLDIGCGPGGWTSVMAQRYYTSMQVTGVDTSAYAIEYANYQASAQKLDNLRYHQVEEPAGPFPFFPDESFDLISGQFLLKSLYPSQWLQLLHECHRLLKPGGKLRLTDFEMGMSNSPAHEELSGLFIQAMRLSGRSNSPTNRHLALLCELEPMVQAADFRPTSTLCHMINYSSGAPLHTEWIRDFLILSKQVLPMLVQQGIATKDRVEMLYLQQKRDMESQQFHAILPFLTVWGTKAL